MPRWITWQKDFLPGREAERGPAVLPERAAGPGPPVAGERGVAPVPQVGLVLRVAPELWVQQAGQGLQVVLALAELGRQVL